MLPRRARFCVVMYNGVCSVEAALRILVVVFILLISGVSRGWFSIDYGLWFGWVAVTVGGGGGIQFGEFIDGRTEFLLDVTEAVFEYVLAVSFLRFTRSYDSVVIVDVQYGRVTCTG